MPQQRWSIVVCVGSALRRGFEETVSEPLPSQRVHLVQRLDTEKPRKHGSQAAGADMDTLERRGAGPTQEPPRAKPKPD